MTCGQLLFLHGGKISNNKNIKRAALFFPRIPSGKPPCNGDGGFLETGVSAGFLLHSALLQPPKGFNYSQPERLLHRTLALKR